jgi:hypothetical protein
MLRQPEIVWDLRKRTTNAVFWTQSIDQFLNCIVSFDYLGSEDEIRGSFDPAFLPSCTIPDETTDTSGRSVKQK